MSTYGSGTYGSGTYGDPGGEVPGPEPIIGRVAVAHEYPPDKLAWRIDPPKGTPSRWAADEPLAENVCEDIQLSEEMPGGEKEATCNLARNPRTPWPDLAQFSNVKVYGPGGEVVWEGRLDKSPESDGDRMAIKPAAVGWKQALEDDNSVIGPGYIDSDLGKWGEPSIQRRLDLGDINYPISASASVAPLGGSSAESGLVFDFSGVQRVEGENPGAELSYYGGGVDLGALLCDFTGDGTTTWAEIPALSSDDVWGSYDGPTNLNGASATQHEVAATTAGRKYAFVQAFYTGSYVGPMTNKHYYTNVKVLGRHPLTLQGTWPNVGYTASQMLRHAIPTYTCLRADAEDVEDTNYIIEQAWFSEPGSILEVVQELTKYELLDWFVRGKRFFLKRPGTYGRRWQAYAGPSGLEEQGEDGSRLWKEITVRGQDVTGRTFTVGPPGSGATVEDARLEITDPDHPAVRAAEAYGPNFTRKDLLDLGGISTPTRAREAGERWLREANLLSRSGSCSLTGYVMDDKGAFWPVSAVRAGDMIRFPDAGDTSYRKVVSRSYSHSNRTASLSLDAPAQGITALLERMQASIKRLQIS